MASYRTIVVGTDFSSLADVGAATAVELANRCQSRWVHLVHVVQSSTPVLPIKSESKSAELSRKAEAAAMERLEKLQLPKNDVRITRQVRFGTPARELSLTADEIHADLVVVASHSQSGLARLVLGSAAGALIRVARCPVLVVNEHSESPGHFERVLAAIDLSPVSLPVLSNAFSVAQAAGSAVKVLCLYEEADDLGEQHRDEVTRLLRRVPKGTLEVSVDVIQRGPTPQAILGVAKETGADLIVMGTSGRNAWHRMILGSTANHVLVKAGCPVLVVPQEARESVKDEAASLQRTPVFEPGS